MSKPALGDLVLARLASGVDRVALIVRIVAVASDATGDRTRIDLWVWGAPADGGPFAAGPAYVLDVQRDQRPVPAANTWRARP